MSTIRFNIEDAEILYLFPKLPLGLISIVHNFTSINRCAPPTYAELSTCLSKALQVGIIERQGDAWVVAAEWYARIHAADDTAPNEIESMLEFEENFIHAEFEGTKDAGAMLSEDEYQTILAKQPRLR